MGKTLQKPFYFTDQQIQALQRLSEALQTCKKRRLEEADVASGEDLATSSRLQHDQFSNVFGLLGPRGSGKSTLLTKLYHMRVRSADEESRPGRTRVERSGAQSKEAQAKEARLSLCREEIGSFIVLPPLDCSLVAENVEPGTAVLIHMWRTLRKTYSTLAKKEPKIFEDLREMAATYSRTASSHDELCKELASSPGDYGGFVVEGVVQRLALPDKFRDWLERALKVLGGDANAILVLLDDFDLVPAREVRRWLLSLLDELHQVRLFFVLTADFYRLQHLSWDPSAEFDDKTGRALLNKLLPSQNSVRLPGWNRSSCFYFPWSSRAEVPAEREPKKKYLAEMVLPFGRNGERENRCQQTLLMQLLPEWPRGIVNLHHTLEETFANVGDGKSLSELERREFLSVLATSRGEPLLARKLLEEGLDSWVEGWKFHDEKLSVEDWQNNVDAAVQRAGVDRQGKDDLLDPACVLKPIRGLAPYRPRRGEVSTAGQGLSGLRRGDNGAEDLNRDPSWRDPLRHASLYRYVLQDAELEAIPFWAELLLHFGLFRFSLEPAQEANVLRLRHRSWFFCQWKAFLGRLGEARFTVATARYTLRQLLTDDRRELPREALAWLTWESADASGADVGWPPLFDALRGARNHLDAAQFTALDVSPGQIRWRADNQDILTLDFLPDQLWAMVLLVEGLDRCPWSSFSGTPGWSLQTHVALAAVLVRCAYIHGLVQGKVLTETSLCPEERQMLGRLRQRNALDLLDERAALEKKEYRGLEERVLDEVVAIFQHELPLTSQDSLSRAAQHYLESPVYTAVRDWVLPAQARGGSSAARVKKDKRPRRKAVPAERK